jgi:hypothetical protein
MDCVAIRPAAAGREDFAHRTIATQDHQFGRFCPAAAQSPRWPAREPEQHRCHLRFAPSPPLSEPGGGTAQRGIAVD